jgi:hypothetical protein
MKIAWERTHHAWDTEIILRTMILGDVDEYKKLLSEVSRDKIRTIYIEKHEKLDKKTQIFWGHLL